jgi:hypothetical protein
VEQQVRFLPSFFCTGMRYDSRLESEAGGWASLVQITELGLEGISSADDPEDEDEEEASSSLLRSINAVSSSSRSKRTSS